MEKLGRLRRLYFRDDLTLSEIARKTGFARNTVKTWLRAAEGVQPKYRRRKGQTKISSYRNRRINLAAKSEGLAGAPQLRA